METFAESENLQSEPSVRVEGPGTSQSLTDDNKSPSSHDLTLTLFDPSVAVAAVDTVNVRSGELVEVPVVVSNAHHTHTIETATQDMQSNKPIASSRSLEDGYNWRKYGQKHIKGSEFRRSYYKCSHPNCQMKKQVELSHDGQITDVFYRGNHDHPKPQPVSHVSACAITSIQGNRSFGISFSKNSQEKSLNGSNQKSPHAKPNVALELSISRELSVGETEDNNVREEQLSKIRDEIQDDNNVREEQLSKIRDEFQDDGNDTESKRRCLNLTMEMISDSGSSEGQRHEHLEAHHGQSQAFVFPSSNEITRADASLEMSATVTAPNLQSNMVITSNGIVPVDVECDDARKTHKVHGVQRLQTDHKGTYTSVTADKLWGDGYSWRKYGQKHIKGSEFPRGYYRCTHPKCEAKRQLECSHDGQITDIVYKGEHNHSKPQPSNHIAIGKILSIQEGGFETTLDHTHDKSFNRQPNHPTELNNNPDLEGCALQTSYTDVQGEGSKLNKTDGKVEQNTGLDPKSDQLNVSTETRENAATGLLRHQCKPSVEVHGQYESQKLVCSPSLKRKETAVSRELIPSTVSTSPVYVVTSRGIVPVGVETEDKRQRQSAGNEAEVEESTQSGLSLSMTEKLLENAYHWRKYGQKNIKGSEFPRSYYRCTHPNCHVKMQLERSHDGRIIEIIYKGKHDHPKPQPITRMAIGAILSLEEDGFDKISDGSGGEKFNHSFNEIEDDNDRESKRRKREVCDMDLTPLIRSPREPRVVVETLSEVDVVDDGYRWQKYGRKIVKGNSYPRNYYRCSISGCSVKKHVERSASNPKLVIMTYEGIHNHDKPHGRIIALEMAGVVSNANDMLGSRSRESAVDGTDDGVITRSSPACRMNEMDEILDAEPIQCEYDNADHALKVTEPASAVGHNGVPEENADQDRLNKTEVRNLSFSIPLNHSTSPKERYMESA